MEGYRDLHYMTLQKMLRERLGIESKDDPVVKTWPTSVEELAVMLERMDEQENNPLTNEDVDSMFAVVEEEIPQEPPPAPPPPVLESKPEPVVSENTKSLGAKISEILPTIHVRETMGWRNPVQEAMTPRNMPPNLAWRWVPYGNPEEVSKARTAGWRPLPVEFITSDLDDDRKIYIPFFDDMSGYAAYQDCIFYVADRKMVENRRQVLRDRWNGVVEKSHGGRRDEQVKDRIVDLSTGHSFRRTSSKGAEDLMLRGDS